MKLKVKIRAILTICAVTLTALAATADSPKYIFYFIGDGMGMGPVMTAETYNREVLGNDSHITMMQFPTVGMCMTWSANSRITDSAAGGTALATGVKTKNNMLGMGPDSTAVISVATRLKNLGWGIGVATSVAPDDATPGAFYAHVPARSMYYEIGKQAASCGFDFLAGAGLRGISDKDGNPTDLLDIMAENGVQIVHGRKGIEQIDSRKVFLLSEPERPSWNIGYTIDSVPGALTLPLITQTCLDHLMKNSPDRFFMMIEGGNIDHALHGNDGGAAIKEILNFNDAIAIAFNFYKEHPDETLIVVTADHDTGGMAMCHPNPPVGNALKLFDYQRVSKEAFSDYCKGILKSRRVYTWDDMKEYLRENLGFYDHVPVSAETEQKLREKFDATFEMRNTEDQKTLYANFNAFAVEVFKVFNDAAGMHFTTTSHSGNPVPVFAVGVGADRFTALNNNLELPVKIFDIAIGK